METLFIKRCFRLSRKDIGYLRFILEGYDGLAFLRTLDGRNGLVEISFSSSRKNEAEDLLAALSMELLWQESSPFRPAGQVDAS